MRLVPTVRCNNFVLHIVRRVYNNSNTTFGWETNTFKSRNYNYHSASESIEGIQ